MNRLLILLGLLVLSHFSEAQTGYLFVKKGFRKKAVYTQGDPIRLRLQSDSVREGIITRLANDTIFLNGRPIPRMDVKEVIISGKQPAFRVPAETFLLITAGVALVTAGLGLSEQATFKEALTAGLVIGYGPLAAGYLKSKISLKRKKYRIGKKFRLQMIDFYLPRGGGF